jgi:ABC-type branched-subunit amino acid transport system substrate-binding protein
MKSAATLFKIASAVGLAFALHAPAEAAEPIVIGQSLPLKAYDDGTSRRVIEGARAYVEAVNARGGIHGRALRLVTLNNEGRPDQDARNISQLVSESKAVAIVSCVGDASCAASAAAASRLGVPLVGPMAAAASLSQASNPLVFRVRVPFDKEASAIARQLVALAAFRVAIVTDQSKNAEVVTAMQEALTQAKASTTIFTVHRGKLESFEAMLKTLSTGKFQAVVLDLGSESIDTIVNHGLEKRDEWPLILAAPATGTVTSLMGSFPGRMLGFAALVPNPESNAVPLVREFQSDVAKYAEGSAVSYVGFESYVNTRFLIEALKRAGPSVQPERLVAALNSLGLVDMGGLALSTRPGRASASDFVEIVVRSRAGVILK